MGNNKSRRLPSGRVTKSVDSYVRAWKRAGGSLGKATGWKMIAFDPGFLYDMGNGRTISIPLDAVKVLTKAIVGNKK